MLTINPQALDHLSDRVITHRPPPGADLLRRRRWLRDEDRVLLELAYEHGMSLRQIGVLFKLSPGSVTRRLQRLGSLLRDPLVMALADADGELPENYQAVGVAYFIHRRPIEQIARLHSITVRQVIARIEYIRGWHRGITSSAR